jgi:activating signal cointegrator complex subunit 3
MSPSHIQELHKFAKTLPYIDIDVQMQPITRSILKISLTIYAEWIWSDRWNGRSEPFWIVIDNGSEILHKEYLSITKKDVRPPGANRNNTMKNQELILTFFIPYQVPEGEMHISESEVYHLGIWSDRWYDLDYDTHLQLSDIAVPDEDYPHTKLLPLRPMPIKSLGNPKFEELYRSKFEFFNPIQTQVFHTLFHTDSNALIGAPTGSGKTIMSELAILRVFANTPNKKVIYIAPLKALAKERIIDWKIRLGSENLKKSVLELTGDNTPDIKALQEADLLITTPEKWDGISRNW